MISSISGDLQHVEQGRVQLRAGPMTYELWVPAADVAHLQTLVGQSLAFHTIFYLEGDAARGGLEPRLIGFLRPQDRQFFELFTTVKGIGTRTALRALTVPISEIAQAIEQRNNRFLIQLDGIGKRTAELIIAELAGKAKRFIAPGATPASRSARTAAQEDAIAALMALDDRLRRGEAESLLDRALHGDPSLQAADALLRAMLHLRNLRA